MAVAPSSSPRGPPIRAPCSCASPSTRTLTQAAPLSAAVVRCFPCSSSWMRGLIPQRWTLADLVCFVDVDNKYHMICSLFCALIPFISPFLQSGSQENLTVDSPRLSTSSEHVQKERSTTKTRGILRSCSGRATPVSSERPPRSTGQPGRPSLRKAESTRVRGSVPIRSSLSSQGKATSVSERLDSASSTLPRASSVISTAEGSTRRTSIHDMLSKDNRQPVSVDGAPPPVSKKAGLRSQPSSSEYHSNSSTLKVPLTTTTTTNPLPKSLSLPCSTLEDPDLSLESFLGPSFTLESVFMDSIFSESADKNLPFLSLNPTLVSNISGPPVTNKSHPSSTHSHISIPNQAPHNQTNGQMRSSPAILTENIGVNDSEQVVNPEDGQSLWYEYGCVWCFFRTLLMRWLNNNFSSSACIYQSTVYLFGVSVSCSSVFWWFFFSPAMFFCPSSYLDLSALMILRWGSTSTNSNGVKASHLRFSHSVFTLLYILTYCFDSCKLSHFDPSDQNAHVFFSFGRFNV